MGIWGNQPFQNDTAADWEDSAPDSAPDDLRAYLWNALTGYYPPEAVEYDPATAGNGLYFRYETSTLQAYAAAEYVARLKFGQIPNVAFRPDRHLVFLSIRTLGLLICAPVPIFSGDWRGEMLKVAEKLSA